MIWNAPTLVMNPGVDKRLIELALAEFAAALKAFKIGTVSSDKYAGEWVVEAFKKGRRNLVRPLGDEAEWEAVTIKKRNLAYLVRQY